MSDAIDAAQREIAQILARLEKETGALVEQVRVEQINVTRMESPREEWQRHVRITLRPVPGSIWTT